MKKILQYKKINYFEDCAFLHSSKNLRIGIYGGSFNPPHTGHLYITQESIKRLNLDMVLWLITPLNPLKSADNHILPTSKRKELCKELTKYNNKIKVNIFEESFNHNYSHLTLKKITDLSNNNNLVWIMGEDNLINFHLFSSWKDIIKDFNIAIFAREKYSFMSLLKKSSIIYRQQQKNYFDNKLLYDNNTKYLKFFLLPKNKLSSTIIRNQTDY